MTPFAVRAYGIIFALTGLKLSADWGHRSAAEPGHAARPGICRSPPASVPGWIIRRYRRYPGVLPGVPEKAQIWKRLRNDGGPQARVSC